MTDSLNGISLRDELAEAIDLINRSFTDKDSRESMNRVLADACLAVMARRLGVTPPELERMEWESSCGFGASTYTMRFILKPPAPKEKP